MSFAGQFQILLVVSMFLLSACEEENCEPFTCGVCPEACERNDQCIDGELQCECNCTDDANYSLADSGSQPQSAACELAEQASMSGCPECDDGLVTCVYGDVSVTVGSCGYCQATNALYQALCDAGSQATATEIEAGLSCSSAVTNEISDAGAADGASAVDSGSDEGSSVSDGGSDGSNVVDAGVAEGLSCSTTGADAQCVYLDSTMGEILTWQGCPAGQAGEDCTGDATPKTHAEALTYCEDLSWGGFDDWVLPNIDKLRSLIRGCPQNELGDDNTCLVTHQCSYEVNDNCTQDSCSGCSFEEGPRSDGCYLPADLPGQCHRFWSSSLRSASRAYDVYFNDGNVNNRNLSNNPKVRCVRSLP